MNKPAPRARISEAFVAESRARPWLLFLRFAVVGLGNTAFGYAAFAVLLLVGAGTVPSLVASAAAGVAFNYQTSKRLVFGSPGRSLRFIAVYGVLVGLDWVALRAFHAVGVSDFTGQAVLALPVAVMSFLGQKMFVFGSAGSRA